MQVVVESTQNLGRKIAITLAAKQIEEKLNSELQRRSKTLRINGFRPGKVPISIVRQHYGKSIHRELQRELMQQSFEQAITQHELQPAGQVQFIPQESSNGEDFSYQAIFEVYPEITLHNLQSIVVEQPLTEVTDADVEDVLLRLHRLFVIWQPADGVAKLGDRVTVNFQGLIEGKEFEGGTATNFSFILGDNQLISQFNDEIIGHKVNDDFIIDVVFPVIYKHAEPLQGKTVQFSIQLIKVEEPLLPEWNQAMIKKIGIADGTIESMKLEIRKEMLLKLKLTIKQHIKSQIFNQLLKLHANLMVPESLINLEMDSHTTHNVKKAQTAELLFDNGLPSPSLSADQKREHARNSVAISLLLKELIKQRQLHLDPEKIKRVLLDSSIDDADQFEMAERFSRDQKFKQYVEGVVLEEQAIESLLAEAKISEKELSFKELILQYG